VSFPTQEKLPNATKQSSKFTKLFKRQAHSVAKTAVRALTAAFFINKKKFKFLIDTGSCVSILPSKMIDEADIKSNPSNLRLCGADGRRVKQFRQAELETENYQLRKTYKWEFVVANVTKPIIGVDFLSKNSLIVYCAAKSLCDSVTGLKQVCTISQIEEPIAVLKNKSDETDIISNKWPTLQTSNKEMSSN